jgi:hypothetical protein
MTRDRFLFFLERSKRAGGNNNDLLVGIRPSSPEVAETLDQMVARRNNSPQRRASYPN